MARKRYSAEQIIGYLRQAEILISEGKTIGEASRQLSMSEPTYYRWRRAYGGMEVDQAQRLKELDLENQRLQSLVADQALHLSILKETARGNFLARRVDVRRSSTSARCRPFPSVGPAVCWDRSDAPSRYTPRMADEEAVLTANIVSLASEYGRRYGYRRIAALLTAGDRRCP